ncbi:MULTISPECIES: hypothetical protein [Amycolatopsis]|uniref:Uncharacterized protein n=1 Tax=Amycolatopsis dendrobii TaxID=2760662 RepID=A0A7W3VWL0_9PSEU|nr:MULTISPECIES: hypothetical protein [Amycolatopsis]MBB1154037.1 hypothetical protein [Amycolatopsis dendrobii]UKD51585.1 hypothetical protein L3Q65_27035 [Amycolatopsis sp. FU40]
MIENRGREVPLSYVVTLLVGVAIGFVLARFGGVLARYPVESALVAVLIAAVAVLAWACREMLHDLLRRDRPAGAEETEAVPVPRLSAHRPPNGVRR